MRLKPLLIAGCLVLSVVAIAAGTTWYKYRQYLDTPISVHEKRSLIVEKGMYYNALLDKLSAEHVIKTPFYLRLYGRLRPEMTRIRAGEYEMTPGMTPRQLLQKLITGDTLKYHFTIIEGTRFSELRHALEERPEMTHTLDQLSDKELEKQLGIDAPSLEGQFLADTYQFERGMSDLDLLRRAHQQLTQTLTELWQKRQAKLPLKTPYQALILASIIEKETGQPDERPKISGVFVRRLEKGMRLQTDPTVIYGMGDRYDGNLRKRDLHRPTPYNTYVIRGLPPTPIALVGPAALSAAVHPAPGKALYFVAKGDGSHAFSETLAEHNAAVAKYQLKRRRDYHSSPGQ